jgi:hypothetical protein
MDKAFHSADNTHRYISGVKDIFTQLSTISHDSYQEWIEYLRSYYSSFDLLHDWARLPFHHRWRSTREIKQVHLRAEFKNALLCSQKRMPGMDNLNAPQRAPRQHIGLTNETWCHGAMEGMVTEKARLQCLTLA